ncbi:MAG: hypothetical protein ACR2OD_11445 [Gaiellaceae bacterium]
MTTAEAYVTAAFLVVLAVVLLWLVIYAFKMRRLEQEVRELEADAPPVRGDTVGTPRVVPAHGTEAQAADVASSESSSAAQSAEPVR